MAKINHHNLAFVRTMLELSLDTLDVTVMIDSRVF